jgi:hypothetical protein
MSSIERRVWIFTTEDDKPTADDADAEGYLLAMDTLGNWTSTFWKAVVDFPDIFIRWMQYPDLVNHLKEFPSEEL